MSLFAQLLNTRMLAFPDAPPYPAGRRAALMNHQAADKLDMLAQIPYRFKGRQGAADGNRPEDLTGTADHDVVNWVRSWKTVEMTRPWRWILSRNAWWWYRGAFGECTPLFGVAPRSSAIDMGTCSRRSMAVSEQAVVGGSGRNVGGGGSRCKHTSVMAAGVPKALDQTRANHC